MSETNDDWNASDPNAAALMSLMESVTPNDGQGQFAKMNTGLAEKQRAKLEAEKAITEELFAEAENANGLIPEIAGRVPEAVVESFEASGEAWDKDQAVTEHDRAKFSAITGIKPSSKQPQQLVEKTFTRSGLRGKASTNVEGEPTNLVWLPTTVDKIEQVYPQRSRISDVGMTVSAAMQQPGMPFPLVGQTGTAYYVKYDITNGLMISSPNMKSVPSTTPSRGGTVSVSRVLGAGGQYSNDDIVTSDIFPETSQFHNVMQGPDLDADDDDKVSGKDALKIAVRPSTSVPKVKPKWPYGPMSDIADRNVYEGKNKSCPECSGRLTLSESSGKPVYECDDCGIEISHKSSVKEELIDSTTEAKNLLISVAKALREDSFNEGLLELSDKLVDHIAEGLLYGTTKKDWNALNKRARQLGIS